MVELAYSNDLAVERPIDFHALFGVLPSPIALVSAGVPGLVVIEANEAFLEQLGLIRSAVVPRRLDEVFLTEQCLRLRAAIVRCVASGRPAKARLIQRLGIDLVRRDVIVSPAPGSPGAKVVLLTIEPPSKVLALSADRQNLFDQLGPLSSSMIYVYDLTKKRTRYIHRELTLLLGLSPTAVDLDEIRGRMHAEDLPLFAEHLGRLRLLADEEISGVTVRMMSATGEWLWIHQRARVFSRDADGQVRRIIGAATDVTQHRALTSALEDASKALADAEATERRRIGRELHDSTAQHLVAIDLSLSALERRTVFAERDSGLVRDIRNELTSAQREIRSFAYLLHPPRLEERGLAETLSAFARGFGVRTALVVRVDVQGEPVRMPLSAELALFRVAQEALMNTFRHAQARIAEVRLTYGADTVRLEVKDDGIGLGALALEAILRDEIGVGIAGMRARMEQSGGRLCIVRADRGLTISAEIPIAPPPLH